MGLERSIEQALALLPVSQPFACPYLAGKQARHQALYWDSWDGVLPSELYQRMMDLRFRRSGRLLYRPVCDDCSLCIPVRIDVSCFRPSDSQRRVLRRNAGVTVEWSSPEFTGEKVELYTRYLDSRHAGGPMAEEASAESLRSFLYESPSETIEAVYRLDGRLIGVGICDVTPVALSTVYFFFDPRETRRSMGVFSSLMEIEQARLRGLRHYYLGYWVPGCRKMDYKASLGPYEALIDGTWQRHQRRNHS